MTTTELAEKLGITRQHVGRYVRAGCPHQGSGRKGDPYTFDEHLVTSWLTSEWSSEKSREPAPDRHCVECGNLIPRSRGGRSFRCETCAPPKTLQELQHCQRCSAPVKRNRGQQSKFCDGCKRLLVEEKRAARAARAERAAKSPAWRARDNAKRRAYRNTTIDGWSQVVHKSLVYAARKAGRDPELCATREEILQICETQNWRCAVTGASLLNSDHTVYGTEQQMLRASIDHIVPQSKGGGDGPDNLRVVLWAVNILRKNSDADQFAADFAEFVQHVRSA